MLEGRLEGVKCFNSFWSYTCGNFEGLPSNTYTNPIVPLCQCIFLLGSWCHPVISQEQYNDSDIAEWADVCLHPLPLFDKCPSVLWYRTEMVCKTQGSTQGPLWSVSLLVINQQLIKHSIMCTFCADVQGPPGEGRPSGEQPGSSLQLPQHMGKLCLYFWRL